MRRFALTLALLFSIVGCSRFSAMSEPPEATLADLPPVTIPQEQAELPRVSLEQLAGIYRDALEVNEDPATRLLVLHRLADIEMLDGEAELAAAQVDEAFFAEAIAAYESLLRDNPQYKFNDRVLYQLSKAYDLSGDSEKSLEVLERLSTAHPGSAHVLEAEFRKAESYFGEADYHRAEGAYARVIEFGQDTPYYTRALYMQGWSRFKQGSYQPSIASFTGTLDQLVPGDNEFDSLPRGERELVQDCLRVLAVVFSYLDGTQTIASAYDQLGVRPYQHLLYQSLGDLYLTQERYRDSAEAYKAYTRRFPDSKVAHLFQIRVIESYEAGGFPDLIVTEKEHYVQAFGVSGQYWLQSNTAAQEVIRPRLKLFIEELAGYYHALAQDAAGTGKEPQLAERHYLQAGDYYQLFIDSFPQDSEVPDMGFLLAESRFEAGDYPSAITAYEWVAYRYSDYARAADAGYSAVLTYQRLAAHVDAAARVELERGRVDSELRFASTFTTDSRAPGVLGHAASALLQQSEYQSAIIAAATITRWQPQPGDDILAPAWLVIGHGHFELQEYASAEQAYQHALVVMPAGNKRHSDTVERLAASVYRQAEEAVASEDYLLAAQQFDRVAAVAPRSEVRVSAQFDAANNYMLAGDMAQANRLLLDFRQRYPKHELTASIGAKLVGNYELLEQWQAAAAELDAIYASQPDGESRRQALYIAAEYYDKVNDRERAIERYRSYAHEWPEPFAARMEAMNRLAQLYDEEGLDEKRRFWLDKIIAAHQGAGSEQSERSLFLAAFASSVLADHDYRAFLDIELRYPIKKSLGKKKTAMERALAAYNRTNDYGVQQFSTLASYRIAGIYQQLSADLIESQRPANIDTLALEQYEMLLEEQAYPFEEKAIAIHESNARRSWDGIYDEWVQDSFVALGELMPGRYLKIENVEQGVSDSATASDDVLAHNRQALSLRQQGRFAEAEREYLEALVLVDSDAITHRNLGILYDMYRGEQDKALLHYQRYQSLTAGSDRTVAGWIADLERQQVMQVGGN